MWAEPLGNDLYKIENVPFYAYGLNFQDIVKATPDSDQILEIRKVVKTNGHRTFRLFFKKHIGRERQDEILLSMRDLKVTYERADDIYVALDMKPEGNYQAVFDKLDEYYEQNILAFETCETRVEGSFDDVPEDE